MSRHIRVCTQVSNLLGGVSLDDDMVKDHVLPKLQKEDIMLDFVHIDEHSGGGGVANGTALTTASDGVTLINQVQALLLDRRSSNHPIVRGHCCKRFAISADAWLCIGLNDVARCGCCADHMCFSPRL